MQKQKLLSVLSLIVVAMMVAGMGGRTVTATPAQTMVATMGSAMSMDIPNTGKITGPDKTEAQELTGAGSTFAVPLYTKWVGDYAKLTNVKINYQGTGSGASIKGVQDNS